MAILNQITPKEAIDLEHQYGAHNDITIFYLRILQ
jgi:hypothetical protein